MLGLGATIIGIGLLYGQILKADSSTYLPFISISLAIWAIISSVISESTTAFVASAHVITSTPVPYSTFVLRCVARNAVVGAHYAVVVAITYLACRYAIHPIALASLAGLVLLLANMTWIALIVGLACTRFRDVAQMVTYLIQLTMFLTPVIWQPSQLRAGSVYLAYNPFYHLIEIVRAPLFDGRFPVHSFVFSSIMLVVGSVVAVFALVKTRRYIAFWI
jgi:lipopolysaccharide transport system permease protein